MKSTQNQNPLLIEILIRIVFIRYYGSYRYSLSVHLKNKIKGKFIKIDQMKVHHLINFKTSSAISRAASGLAN